MRDTACRTEKCIVNIGEEGGRGREGGRETAHVDSANGLEITRPVFSFAARNDSFPFRLR